MNRSRSTTRRSTWWWRYYAACAAAGPFLCARYEHHGRDRSCAGSSRNCSNQTEPWKIAYFHHPLYGNAGTATARRWTSACCSNRCSSSSGVAVVFTGHDHVYERLKPQNGVHYFVTGSGGKLRTGDLVPSESTAAGFDRDQAFVIAEIDGDALFFQTISRTGATVDSGVIPWPLRHDGTR